jgi:hypothetical protein
MNLSVCEDHCTNMVPSCNPMFSSMMIIYAWQQWSVCWFIYLVHMMNIEYQVEVLPMMLGFSASQGMREILLPNVFVQSTNLGGKCWTVDWKSKIKIVASEGAMKARDALPSWISWDWSMNSDLSYGIHSFQRVSIVWCPAAMKSSTRRPWYSRTLSWTSPF